jgi:Ohr subfamily peroxiredoxin
MKAIYTATATATGGGNGRVISKDGILDLKLSMPKEMGGDGKHTNPEEILAAGWAACFDTALMMAAGKKNIDAGKAEVTVAVGITPAEVGFRLSSRIDVVFKGLSDADAKHLVEEAHKLCPYCSATRGNVDTELNYSIK